MIREARLQVRIEPDLLKWFREHANGRGGMSRLVTEHILRLKAREKSKERQKDGSAPAEK